MKISHYLLEFQPHGVGLAIDAIIAIIMTRGVDRVISYQVVTDVTLEIEETEDWLASLKHSW